MTKISDQWIEVEDRFVIENKGMGEDRIKVLPIYNTTTAVDDLTKRFLFVWDLYPLIYRYGVFILKIKETFFLYIL